VPVAHCCQQAQYAERRHAQKLGVVVVHTTYVQERPKRWAEYVHDRKHVWQDAIHPYRGCSCREHRRFVNHTDQSRLAYGGMNFTIQVGTLKMIAHLYNHSGRVAQKLRCCCPLHGCCSDEQDDDHSHRCACDCDMRCQPAAQKNAASDHVSSHVTMPVLLRHLQP